MFFEMLNDPIFLISAIFMSLFVYCTKSVSFRIKSILSYKTFQAIVEIKFFVQKLFYKHALHLSINILGFKLKSN